MNVLVFHSCAIAMYAPKTCSALVILGLACSSPQKCMVCCEHIVPLLRLEQWEQFTFTGRHNTAGSEA